MWSFDSGMVCITGYSGNTTCLSGVTVAGAILLLGSVVVACLIPLVVDSRRTVKPSQMAARADRHSTLASMTGVALLVTTLLYLLAMATIATALGYGRLFAALPAIAGAGMLLALSFGQLTWPRPTGQYREAELMRRSVAEIAPRLQRRLVFCWAGSLIPMLVGFALLAGSPRTLSPNGVAPLPYPGSHYGVPLSIAIVALVLASELVLRQIALRPAVVGVSAAWDLHLRRRSARHLSRAIQLVLAVTVAAVLTLAGFAHRLSAGSGDTPEYSTSTHQLLSTGLLVAAAIVLLTGAVATVVPLRTTRPRSEAVIAAVTVP